jgi:hypothetical protein
MIRKSVKRFSDWIMLKTTSEGAMMIDRANQGQHRWSIFSA